MSESVSITSGTVVGARLKQARLATGMSTRAVASDLGERSPADAVSHTTIAKYEKGTASPPVKVLSALADLYERPLQWFLDRGAPLTNIRYRCASSRVLVGEKHRYEAQAQHWLEAYKKLERRIERPLIAKLAIKPKLKRLEPQQLAEHIRCECKIDPAAPIVSVIDIMERFGIRVLELPTQCRIDGLAAKFGDEHAVVLNPTTANDRARMNAVHEMVHVFHGDCDHGAKASKLMEEKAFSTASHFLIPQSELERAFKGRSAVKLVQAKERFGISMAAMIYRAEKTGVIDSNSAKRLWIQFAKRGWRANEPGDVRPDRAIRFERLLDEALSEKRIRWSEATALTGSSRSDLNQRLRLAMGRVPIAQSDENRTEEKGGPITLKLHDAR